MVHYTKDRILKLVDDRSVLFSKHAKERMVKRGIDTDDIIHVIACGEIVKDYSDDRPCPSFLMLGNSRLECCVA